MARYHELMEYVEVTREMEERILENINHHFTRKAKTKKRAVISLFVASGAAAVFGIVFWNPSVRLKNQESSEMIQGIYGEEEYSSVEEMSEAAGFPVEEVKNIPFEVEKAEYRLLHGNLAEIIYSGKDETLAFRKSEGEEDNSGDYTVYEEEKEEQVQGKTVILKGEQGKYFLAVWKEEGYSYSLWDAQGLEKELFLKMISESE